MQILKGNRESQAQTSILKKLINVTIHSGINCHSQNLGAQADAAARTLVGRGLGHHVLYFCWWCRCLVPPKSCMSTCLQIDAAGTSGAGRRFTVMVSGVSICDVCCSNKRRRFELHPFDPSRFGFSPASLSGCNFQLARALPEGFKVEVKSDRKRP